MCVINANVRNVKAIPPSKRRPIVYHDRLLYASLCMSFSLLASGSLDMEKKRTLVVSLLQLHSLGMPP